MSDDDEFEFQGFAPAVPARDPPPIPGGGGGGASSGASSSSPKNQPSIGHASSLSSNTKPRSSLSSGVPVQDQHYDEAVDAESSDSLAMGGGGGGGGGGGAAGGGNFRGSTGGAAASSGAGRSHNVDDDDDDDEGDGDDDDDVPEGESNDSVPAMPMNPKRGQGMMQFNKSKSDDAESEEETDGENESTTSASASTLSAMGAPGAGGGAGGAGGGGAGGASVPLYSPSQFSNLNVSSEIQSLFDYIQRHTPQPIQLPTPFTPFIPEYIPSIGEIDAFLKPPAPDSSFECAHGLKFVDEPSTKQSDVGVLELSLRVIGKGRGGATAKVRSLEYADRNPKKLQRWIESIDEVHRSKPAQTVMYSKPMPDIERLMQAWPAELEQAFKAAQAELQQGGTDMSTTELARLACAILDIPVHERMIESLHVLFTLYSEFRSNSHFA